MPYPGCPCFWLEPTGRQGVFLRRYRSATEGGACPLPGGYHDAEVQIGYVALVYGPDGTRGPLEPVPSDHWLWPAACACGYQFGPDDERQTNGHPEYQLASGDLICGEPHRLPPGSLFHLGWTPLGEWRDRYGDGINLYAVCPNGSYWNVDGPAYSSGDVTTQEAWTRTGDPRRPETLSATPSIIAGDYHGFLTAGFFSPG